MYNQLQDGFFTDSQRRKYVQVEILISDRCLATDILFVAAFYAADSDSFCNADHDGHRNSNCNTDTIAYGDRDVHPDGNSHIIWYINP